jgi:flagellar biosynthesis protein FliR
MLSVTSTQIDAWLGVFFWPFLRILALFLADPFFGHRATPRRVRVGFAVILSVVIAPIIPPIPPIPFDSALAWGVAMQQLMVGFILGFSMRLVLSAVDMSGQQMSLGMGFGFATFFDPSNGANTPVIGQFMTIFALLIFLSIGGHLMVISTLVESFHILPIGTGLGANGFRALAAMGAQVFIAGLILALPVIAVLLIVNVAMGILTRAAPQLNIFAVGFPLMIAAGLFVLLMALSALQGPIVRLWEEGVLDALRLLQQFRP